MHRYYGTVSLDITQQKQERKALKEAKEKAEIANKAELELRQAVTILAGSIAHDLRTPVSVIQMDANLLKRFLPTLLAVYKKARENQLLSKDQDITKKQLDRLEMLGQSIQETAQQMLAFIDVTLKTLSKALKGDMVPQDLSPCSMWHCIHNTLTRYPFTEEQRGLVKWDQHDFSFMGNELIMTRVFFNLLDNALQKIIKNERGEILISTEIKGLVNIVRFKDTAGGVSPEIITRIFDGYYSTKDKGTGIGLAFCKLAMQSFSGEITCHSVDSDYIEFVLTFPNLPA